MKKGWICAALALALCFPAKAAEVEIPAPSAVLMDAATGTVLYEKDAHEALPPASVTKVMTLLLVMEALEDGTIGWDDTVTASEHAAGKGGSQVYLEPGEGMSMDEMLKSVVVSSANDCATALAEHVAGSEEAFVERMNARARELGMNDTHFVNCTGLDDDPAAAEHRSSAWDIAIMSRELLRHEAIKEYTTIWMDSIRDGSFELANTNKLVYWYPGCTGLKTGYTSTARYCLSASAERNGVEYIAVVMHGETADSRNRDAETLLSYAFANYRLIPLHDGKELPALPVELGKKKVVPLCFDGAAYQLAVKGGQPEYALTLPARLAAPIQAGQQIGNLRVSVGGEQIAEVPVCAAEDIPRIGFGGILAKLALSLVGI